MAPNISPPNTHDLLPPLLACLPTAFLSPTPPPSLLPLLSPILRQRVQLLSSTLAPSNNGQRSTDSWLPLLCWDRGQASLLPGIVENGVFEPHPVSGEIEVEGAEEVRYKRVDEETLKARVVLRNWGLTVVFLWCREEEGERWLVGELLPASGEEENEEGWEAGVEAAESKARERLFEEVMRSHQTAHGNGHDHANGNANSATQQNAEAEEEDDDDDYWAQYDATPGRTPAVKRSPAPTNGGSNRWQSTTYDNGNDKEEEDAYFSQYADVQPAMDRHDPDEEAANGEVAKETGEEAPASSLHGDLFASLMQQAQAQQAQAITTTQRDEPTTTSLSHPRPSSSSSTTSERMINRLESHAETQSAAETGVRQHISTSVKSLFRLARTVGIERAEFERIVAREVEVLGIGIED